MDKYISEFAELFNKIEKDLLSKRIKKGIREAKKRKGIKE